MAAAPARKVHTNHYSSHMGDQDREILTEVMGHQRVFTHSAVAKFLKTTGPQHDSWVEAGYGMVCLVRDRERKSYFIQFVEMSQQTMCWEEELYARMEIVSHSTNFISFESKTCIAGFAFPYSTERDSFKDAVCDILNAFIRQVASRKNGTEQTLQGDSVTYDEQKKFEKSKWKAPINFLGKKKRNKSQECVIGEPMEFQKDGQSGIESTRNAIPEEKLDKLLSLLKKDKNNIEQKEMDKIYRCIAKCGGIDKLIYSISGIKDDRKAAAKHSPDSAKRSPQPPMPPTKKTVTPDSMAAPPVPRRPTENTSLPASVTRAAPALPSCASSNSIGQSPSKISLPSKSRAPPLPPTRSASAITGTGPAPAPAPAPPPPPPPPPPVVTTSSSSKPLLTPTPKSSAPSDGRSSLLSDISKGKSLKKVQEITKPESPPADDSEASVDLTDTLMNALKRMRPDLEYSESDEEDDSDAMSFDDDFD